MSWFHSEWLQMLWYVVLGYSLAVAGVHRCFRRLLARQAVPPPDDGVAPVDRVKAPVDRVRPPRGPAPVPTRVPTTPMPPRIGTQTVPPMVMVALPADLPIRSIPQPRPHPTDLSVAAPSRLIEVSDARQTPWWHSARS